MGLRIAVVTDKSSWMTPHSEKLVMVWKSGGHHAELHSSPDYDAVDLAFYLSYGRIVGPEVLTRARNNLVVHGSDLPEGRGWSPWSWQILEGRNRLPLTLIEAEEGVDSGVVYDQKWVELEGHELIEEWQTRQAEATLSICLDFVSRYPQILAKGRAQSGRESVYARRRPSDSVLDPKRSISDQFGLMRIVDNVRYPAFFDHEGHRYILTIRKADSN